MEIFLKTFQVHVEITIRYRTSWKLSPTRWGLLSTAHRFVFILPTFEAIDGANHNHIEWLAERWGFLDLLPEDWRTPDLTDLEDAVYF